MTHPETRTVQGCARCQRHTFAILEQEVAFGRAARFRVNAKTPRVVVQSQAALDVSRRELARLREQMLIHLRDEHQMADA